MVELGFIIARFFVAFSGVVVVAGLVEGLKEIDKRYIVLKVEEWKELKTLNRELLKKKRILENSVVKIAIEKGKV